MKHDLITDRVMPEIRLQKKIFFQKTWVSQKLFLFSGYLL